MNQRVLIIGIDGGTWSILEPAIQQGHMPYLNKLLQRASYGILESTMPAITPAAWGSFQTGMNPGKNGAFDFCYWDIKQKKKHYVNSQTLCTTIWEVASDQNRRVGVINVPMTYPPKPVNGYMVTGILTPSQESEFTYPQSLKQELQKAVPDYHVFNTQQLRTLLEERFEPFVEQMIKSIEVRAETALFILGKEPLDLFMVHFQASDVLQHRFWAYLEEGNPLFNHEKRDYAFGTFYKCLDQKIEQVKEVFEKQADTDHVTFIVSDHGFQRHKKRFNLAKWLLQQGYMRFSKRFFWFPLFKDLLGKVDVLRLRRKLIGKLKSQTGRMLFIEGPVSWENSTVFSCGTIGEGFIYLLEEDESKRKQTASQLISKLKEIVDPEDGTPIVKQVYHKEEIFKGDFLRFMPDLTIEPTDGYTFSGYYKVTSGLFHKIKMRGEFHVGRHHKDGILIAAGNPIRHLDNIKAHITDMAPTILYYLGLPIDEKVDGRVLKEIFREEFLSKQPLSKSSRTGSEETSYDRTERVYSEEDRQQIERRLKDLGYL